MCRQNNTKWERIYQRQEPKITVKAWDMTKTKQREGENKKLKVTFVKVYKETNLYEGQVWKENKKKVINLWKY